MSDYKSNPKIRKHISDLIELFKNNPANGNSQVILDLDHNTNHQLHIDSLIRFLRPYQPSNYDHTSAIKIRLRKSILNQNLIDTSILLTKFEKQCDQILKLNPSLLNLFLIILQPLSFRKSIPMITNISSIIKDDILPSINYQDNKHNNELNLNKHSNNLNNKQMKTSELDEKDIEFIHKLQSIESTTVWISLEVEHLILFDLIYILQVIIIIYIIEY